VVIQSVALQLQGALSQCPDCEAGYLSEQWCPDCSRPCQRLGAGGICPCYEEMTTVEELTEDTVASQPLRDQHTRPSLKKPPRFEGKLKEADDVGSEAGPRLAELVHRAAVAGRLDVQVKFEQGSCRP
jgi:hypothetical protein